MSVETPRSDKPPYRVPTMAEVQAIPLNGRKVASLFSGCGGSSLGYRMAGFKVVWANEFVEAARTCYRANFPETTLDPRDIRTIEGEEVLAALGMAVGEIDVLDGSPPCASFSTAGKREKSWGKVKAYSETRQRTDDLFFEYARLLRGIQPKAFVAENVSGLVKGTAKGYFKEILAELKACGYKVSARVLDAQWLGVPQMRQRLIFVGVREDLGREPAFPRPLSYRYSVRDALPSLVGVQHVAANKVGWRGSNHPCQTIPASGATLTETAHQSFGGFVEAVVGIEDANGYSGHAYYGAERPMDTVQAQRPVRVAVRAFRDDRVAFGNGGDVTDRPSPTGLSDSVGTHWIEETPVAVDTFKGRRSIKEPAPTILTHGRKQTSNELTVVTQTARRKFTIAELKRICAFPDDFTLTGTYAQQWERLGRAVPPLMMRAIATALYEGVFAEENDRAR